MSFIQLLFDRQSMVCHHRFRMSRVGRDLKNNLVPTPCRAQMLDQQSKVLFAIDLLCYLQKVILFSIPVFLSKSKDINSSIVPVDSVNNPRSTSPCLNHRFFSSSDWTIIMKDEKASYAVDLQRNTINSSDFHKEKQGLDTYLNQADTLN